MEFFTEENDQTQKTYVILGAHRCGTSFLARALSAVGVLISGSKARHEDLTFVKLNERILADSDIDWRHPPSGPIKCGRFDEIKRLLDLKKRGKFWGWKDPRQALTIEHYLPYLEGDVYLVCIFRKPERSARSLARLGQTDNGEQMSLEYNRRIIEAIKTFVGL